MYVPRCPLHCVKDITNILYWGWGWWIMWPSIQHTCFRLACSQLPQPTHLVETPTQHVFAIRRMPSCGHGVNATQVTAHLQATPFPLYVGYTDHLLHKWYEYQHHWSILYVIGRILCNALPHRTRKNKTSIVSKPGHHNYMVQWGTKPFKCLLKLDCFLNNSGTT